MSQAQLSDIGPWTCEAINSVGTASRQIEIQAIYSKFSFLKEVSQGYCIDLEKITLHFTSSSFVIRVNLLHSQLSLFLFWFIIISLVFFYLSKLSFSGSFNQKVI